MAKVRSSETRPEIAVRRFLFSKGFRYRKNVAQLPGKPDIVMPKFKTIIFIHGCFWHGHKGCKAADLPKSNFDYWTNKIRRNVERDESNINKLREREWKVITVWECEIRRVLAIKTSHREKFLKILKNFDRPL